MLKVLAMSSVTARVSGCWPFCKDAACDTAVRMAEHQVVNKMPLLSYCLRSLGLRRVSGQRCTSSQLAPAHSRMASIEQRQ